MQTREEIEEEYKIKLNNLSFFERTNALIPKTTLPGKFYVRDKPFRSVRCWVNYGCPTLSDALAILDVYQTARPIYLAYDNRQSCSSEFCYDPTGLPNLSDVSRYFHIMARMDLFSQKLKAYAELPDGTVVEVNCEIGNAYRDGGPFGHYYTDKEPYHTQYYRYIAVERVKAVRRLAYSGGSTHGTGSARLFQYYWLDADTFNLAMADLQSKEG